MKIKIPFWLQIGCILFAGVGLSVAMLVAANHTNMKKQKEQLGTHTVTFAYLDGTVIETKEVAHGKGVFPPTVENDGVYRGWSAGFNMVTADVEVHPVFHNKAEANLFYFDSVYVKEGERFSIDLSVGGQVSVSSGELTLEYDPDVLRFIKAEDNIDGVTVSHSKGKLVVTLDCEDVLKTETVLSQLQFKAKRKDAYSTEMLLKATNVEVVSEGTKKPADCATLNNKIFFLQEVEK